MPTYSSFPATGQPDIASHFAIGPQRTESHSDGSDSERGSFADRRAGSPPTPRSGSFQNTRQTRPNAERRQFGSSHAGLSDDGRELALAIDQYKLEHHRRYITCDEMLSVLRSLGYDRNA